MKGVPLILPKCSLVEACEIENLGLVTVGKKAQESIHKMFQRGKLPFPGFVVMTKKIEDQGGMGKLIDWMADYFAFRLCMMRLLKDNSRNFGAVFSQVCFTLASLQTARSEQHAKRMRAIFARTMLCQP